MNVKHFISLSLYCLSKGILAIEFNLYHFGITLFHSSGGIIKNYQNQLSIALK